MLETLSAQLADISYPLLDASLKHEEKVLLEGDIGSTRLHPPMLSFLEASDYDRKHYLPADVLAQEDDSEHTAVRAAAYHTSAVLEAAAKVSHAIIDAHTHNSSQEATVQ